MWQRRDLTLREGEVWWIGANERKWMGWGAHKCKRTFGEG